MLQSEFPTFFHYPLTTHYRNVAAVLFKKYNDEKSETWKEDERGFVTNGKTNIKAAFAGIIPAGLIYPCTKRVFNVIVGSFQCHCWQFLMLL